MRTDPIQKNFTKVQGKLAVLETRVFSGSTVTRLKESTPIVNKDTSTTEKTYSTSSVAEDLRMARMMPRARFRRVILDYSNYYRINSQRLSVEDSKNLKENFNSKVMTTFNQITEQVVAGGNICTILGLSSIDEEVFRAGSKLAPIYKKSVQTERALGKVPGNIYVKLNELFDAFMRKLIEFVFSEKELDPSLLQIQDALDE